MPNIRVPKQSDREIVAAFGRVAKDVSGRTFSIRVHVTYSPGPGFYEVDAHNEPEKQPSLDFVLKHEGRLANTIQLFDRGMNLAAVQLNRDQSNPSDSLDVGPGNYFDQISDQTNRSQTYVSLLAGCRHQLKASDFESAFDGLGEKPWTKYLEGQREVLNALQSTTQRLLIDASKRNDEAEVAQRTRFEQMDAEFRAKAESERKLIAVEKQQAEEEIKARAAELQKRVEAFNTKEGRYVARQKQDEQIKQVAAWIEKWDLTTSTNAKRRPITQGYFAAIILTGGFTVWISYLSAESLRGNLATLNWWQWTWLSLKTVLPLAACTTFIAYFIRWSASWARMHADEEIRNRARLIDIGRSGWLLEAVRDAQEHNKELPPELVKELSRNLFTLATSAESESHPQTATDMLLQGLSSLRVKAADGSEVEAKRGAPKK